MQKWRGHFHDLQGDNVIYLYQFQLRGAERQPQQRGLHLGGGQKPHSTGPRQQKEPAADYGAVKGFETPHRPPGPTQKSHSGTHAH